MINAMTKLSSQNAPRHFEVLVIGAGISGLACASKLYKNDYFKQPGRLLVLEARHRIGGRIESITVGDSRLDTGANWIHGVGNAGRPNPLLKLMEKRRFRSLSGVVAFRAPEKESTIPTAGHTESNSVSSTKDTSLVIHSDVAGLITGSLFETLGALDEASSEMTPEQAKDTTIYKAILNTDTFKETYESLPAEYHTTFGSMFQFVENVEAGPLIEASFERPEGKPTMSMLEYAIDDFGGDQAFVQDGYASFIDELAEDLTNGGLIKLNTEVVHIDWTTSPIRIQAGHGFYTADKLLCTLPLGVLKDRKPDLFTPPLPSDKSGAISSLGFGTLDKIFLVFGEPWWEKDPFLSIIKRGLVKAHWGVESTLDTPDTFMGFAEELAGFCINEDGTISPAPRDVSVVNLQNLTGFPVLSCFFSCSTAIRVERMTNEEAGDMIHRSLNAWFGQNTPKPTAVHVTRWAQDKYSKGSYSHMIAGLSEAEHRVSFQTPMTDSEGAQLRFAGEHTSGNHFATVHGAYLSGEREADAILKEMNLV